MNAWNRMTPAQRATYAVERAHRERADQGLTEHVTDPVAIDRVATLLRRSPSTAHERTTNREGVA